MILQLGSCSVSEEQFENIFEKPKYPGFTPQPGKTYKNSCEMVAGGSAQQCEREKIIGLLPISGIL